MFTTLQSWSIQKFATLFLSVVGSAICTGSKTVKNLEIWHFPYWVSWIIRPILLSPQHRYQRIFAKNSHLWTTVQNGDARCGWSFAAWMWTKYTQERNLIEASFSEHAEAEYQEEIQAFIHSEWSFRQVGVLR